MIQLGSKVRDTVTGFTGLAVSRTEFLHGCVRVGIEPQTLHEGKPMDAHWFDEQRVVLVEELEPEVSPLSSATSGGPQKDPPVSSRRL
jgi:hypothetical protein